MQNKYLPKARALQLFSPAEAEITKNRCFFLRGETLKSRSLALDLSLI